MPTKPSVTVNTFSSNTNYAGLTGDAAALNGTATKIDGGAAFRNNGAAPDGTAPAQWFNFDFNIWSQLINWVNLGTNAADEDAHVVETESDGRLRAAFGQFSDGAAAHPVVQIDMTAAGSNNGLLITGTGALTADGAHIDLSGASAGKALTVEGSTGATDPAIEAIGGANAPALSATSDSGTGASTASNTAIAGATTTGKGVLALGFGSGDALVAQSTATNGRAVYVDGTTGGARTVPLVAISSSHTGGSSCVDIIQSGDAPCLSARSTHAGTNDVIAATHSGTGDVISAGHTGTAGNVFRLQGSATNPDALMNGNILSTTGAGVVMTSAGGATTGYCISATAQGGASSYRGIATGTGNAGFFFHSGTGDTIRCNRGSDNIYLHTNAGADIATTHKASDPSVSGSLIQVWGRSIASLSRLAMTYVSGAGRLFVHGSKHGYVYGVSASGSGTINEPAATSTTVVDTFRYVQDAYPVTTGGLLHYRASGRVKRSTVGTINELGALGVEMYDLTATSAMTAIGGNTVDFSYNGSNDRWVYFSFHGTYTIPATGDRQFQIRIWLQGSGGAGVVDYANVSAEVWQEERRT